MSDTKIEWADKVWNPVTGCTPISEGCKNCYAARMAKRLAGRYGYPKDEPFKPTFHPAKLDEPMRLRKQNKIFVCSMGDLFHDAVTQTHLDVVWAVMAICGMDWARYLPNHDDLTGDEPLQPKQTFIVLTKRPERMRDYLSNPQLISRWTYEGFDQLGWEGNLQDVIERVKFPLSNVWLGVTAENQRTADERIPILLQIPAAKHFVSVEPMLEKINLSDYLWEHDNRDGLSERDGLDWVIAGPETGPGARPCDRNWINNLWEQCKAAGVPFFDKKDELNRGIQEWPR